MTKAEFVNIVEDYISVGCGIPIRLKAKQFDTVLKLASSWFYRNWSEAVSPEFVVIDSRMFQTKEFREKRKIKFPDCVVTVDMCKESDSTVFTSSPDKDFSSNKFILSDVYLTPFESDALVYRTAQFSFFDLAKQFVLQDIQYRYNPNTKYLTIMGREPRKSVICKVWSEIDQEDLFEDEKFQRYVIAEVKIQLGRARTFIEYPLIGDATLNASSLVDEGREEKERVITEIREEENDSGSIMIYA